MSGRIPVHQLDDEGRADGDYVVNIAGDDVSLTPLPAFTFNPLVTVVGGVPGLVFDADGLIVYLEV